MVAEWQRPVIEAAKIGRLPVAEFVSQREPANAVDPDADDRVVLPSVPTRCGRKVRAEPFGSEQNGQCGRGLCRGRHGLPAVVQRLRR